MNDLINLPIKLHIQKFEQNTLQTVSELIFPPLINSLKTGGQTDLDIFDVEEQPKPKPPMPEVKPEKPSKPGKPRPEKPKFHVTELPILYPEDRISEFKEKIYVATNIPPYKQHLYIILQNGESLAMRYKIIGDYVQTVDIRKLYDNVNKILNIPVDINFFQNKDILYVEALDVFTTLQNIYVKFGIHDYYLLDIDDFLAENKPSLQAIINDSYQIQLLYYGFVIKYWPMFTLDILKYYITDEPAIRQVYPDLLPTDANKFIKEQKVLNLKYQLLNNPNKFPKFNKYLLDIFNQKAQTKDKIINVAIKSATLLVNVNTTDAEIELSSQIKINIRNLFEYYSVNDDIPLIRVRLLTAGRAIILTKIKAPSVSEADPNDIQKIYEKIKYRLAISGSSIIFVLHVKKYQKEYGDQNYLILTIRESGRIDVKSVWDEDTQMDFNTIYDIIVDTVNPVIANINKLGRTIFDTVQKLPIIDKNNHEFSNLNINIFWRMPITSTDFENFNNLIKSDMEARIIHPVEGLIDASEIISGAYNYFMYKGMTEIDTNILEKLLNVYNQYEYLSNAKIKQKFAMIDSGRLVNITHRTTDVKIEVQRLRELEFILFYQYCITFLYRVETEILGKTSKKIKSEISGNILKLAKSRDPELYIFKKFGSDVVFSRICQKDHQAIPYLPEEYELADEKIKKHAVKYWNFTTQSPMYYYCPNPNYPYLNFIVDQHPRGYCLPCCKKTPPIDYELLSKAKSKRRNKTEKISKKDHVYNICITQHQYSEQDVEAGQSRYIMNYGKPVDIGRISKLPDLLDRYLVYNIEDVDILNVENQIFVLESSKPYYPIINKPKKFKRINKQIKVKSEDEIKQSYETFTDEIKPLSNVIPENTLPENEPEEITEIIEPEEITGTAENKTRQYNVNELLKITRNNDVINEPMHKFLDLLNNCNVDKKVNVLEIIKNPDNYQEYYNKIINADTTQAILVYVHEKQIKIIDGLFRLTKLYMNNAETVPTRYTSKSQLNRAEIIDSFDKKETTNLRKPGYYLYGVPQNNVNVSNIGAVYSLCAALNMEFKDFILKTVELLQNSELNYFKILLNGKLPEYFSNLNNLIMIMMRLFTDENITLGADINFRFYYWNELFIDITKYLYKKYVIVLDDTSIDITGTSIKAAKSSENIDLILPDSIVKLDEVIPEENVVAVTEYILLLRKRKKSRSLFNPNKLYYPIFIFIPQTFFKTLYIEKRIYNHHDEIIKLIRQILLDLSAESDAVNSKELNLSIVLRFMQYLAEQKIPASIKFLLVNNKNLIYAAVLQINKYTVHLPITLSSLLYTAEKYPLNYEPFNVNMIDCNYRQYKEFIELYNTFVIEESERQNLFKISYEIDKTASKLNQREAKIIPVYDLLKITDILIYAPNKSASKIIGVQINNMMHYFNAESADKLKNMIKTFADDYNVFVNLPPNVKYVYHNPDKINKLINSVINNEAKTEPMQNNVQLLNAIYHKYIYQLFVLEFMTYIDDDRDIKTRKQIYEIVRRIDVKNPDNNVKLIKELAGLVNSTDFYKINNFINNYLTAHFDKKLLIADTESAIYEFDRTTLIKLQELSNEYYADLSKSAHKKKAAIINLIRQISKYIVKKGMPKFTNMDLIENIFVPCSSKTDAGKHCRKHKLLISPADLDIVTELFMYDIVNPIKREYLLNSIMLNKIQNYFQIRKKPNEEIYIKFE